MGQVHGDFGNWVNLSGQVLTFASVHLLPAGWLVVKWLSVYHSIRGHERYSQAADPAVVVFRLLICTPGG